MLQFTCDSRRTAAWLCALTLLLIGFAAVLHALANLSEHVCQDCLAASSAVGLKHSQFIGSQWALAIACLHETNLTRQIRW